MVRDNLNESTGATDFNNFTRDTRRDERPLSFRTTRACANTLLRTAEFTWFTRVLPLEFLALQQAKGHLNHTERKERPAVILKKINPSMHFCLRCVKRSPL